MPRSFWKLFAFANENSICQRFFVWCFAVCLVGILIGCKGGARRSASHTELTGTVTYKGKPLSGGRITFLGDEWVSIDAQIDEGGHYKINAPVGSVKIGIDNRMVQKGATKELFSKGAGPRPGGPAPEPIKGTYVQIPSKYYDPSSSGLNHTVKSGQEPLDIDLKD